MKVGIIQSNYIPWRGYFDFISEVDLFVFLDDVQYTSRDWRNRNKIKTPNGLQWLSVPVKSQSQKQLINETLIDYSENWQKKHLKAFEYNYSKAQFLPDAKKILEDSFLHNDETISQLNIRLISSICGYLGIETKLVLSSAYKASGVKQEKLINLVNAVEGDYYLSGPAAQDYIDEDSFIKAGIKLEYKRYDYDSYPQLWGEFEGAVTILDLIANCGPDAIKYIHTK